MSGQQTISTSETRIEALQLQSSAYGAVIPVVGGVTRIPGNLVYYTDFKAVPNSTSSGGGKGGGVKTTNTTYNYYASIIMALAHGQITALPRIWKGKTLVQDSVNQTFTQASESYNVPAGGGTYTVSHAAAFGSNGAVSYAGFYDEWGIPGGIVLSEGIDYSVSNGVYTFPAGSVAVGQSVSISYSWISATTPNSALNQLGATLLPGYTGQAAPSWATTRHPTEALGYAGLAVVSADAYVLGSGAQVDNHTFEVVTNGAYKISASVPDIDPSVFAVKVLQDSRYGARLPSRYVDGITNWSTYCLANNIVLSPALTTQVKASEWLKKMATITNTGLVWSDGRLSFVPYGDAAASANGASFTPNTTPVYALTDDAFITQGAEPPVRITRKASSQAYNHIRIQFSNRANSYAVEVAEAKDQADIEASGLRSAPIFNADEICDAAVARNVAQLMLQRSLYVRATYDFTLPWNFCLLDAMDLVTLTDTAQGLNGYTVRITKCEERDGELSFSAEDFNFGVGSTATYSTQVGSGFAHNYNVSPGSVSAPVIFEAPVSLTSTGLEVYVAAAGASANWGGARVWTSLDGTNYKQVGTLNGPSRYGKLSTQAGSTVGVSNLTGTLTSGSAADSAAYSTLCYVGGATPEYLAFTTASLTGVGAYTLGGLTRGGYSTASTAHQVNDPFVRVDAAVAKSGPLDLSMIGKSIYIKLTSFNVYGGAEESIANVPAYAYTITGAMAKLPPLPPTGFAASNEPFGVRMACVKSPDPDVSNYEYRTGPTWATATVLEPAGGTSYLWQVQALGSYTVWVAAVDVFGNYSTPVSAVATVAGPSVNSLSSQIVGSNLMLTWQGVAGAFAVAAFEVRYGATWSAGTSVGTSQSSTYVEPVRWSGSRTYWVAAIDVKGNYGTPAQLTATPNVPSAVTGTYATVVDNNVLLYWAAAAVGFGQLTVASYEVRKGSAWATASVIGSNGNSTFTGVFEQTSGTYTYWVAAIDTAGNYGPPSTIVASVSQPPDFILRNNFNSALNGTLTNLYVEAGALIGPVNTAQTWASHFTGNAWATPQDQVNAGFPVYATPSVTTGSYEELIDYGTALPTSTVTATLNSTVVVGTVGVVCTISWRLLATDAWTVLPSGTTSLIPSSFRYVRVRYDFSATAGSNLIKVTGLNVRLSVKNRSDSGAGVSAIGGVAMTFGYPFVAADTPQVQAAGLDASSKPYTVAVIYTATPNPTGFSVRIYNSAGTEVSGVTFSWTCRGY